MEIDSSSESEDDICYIVYDSHSKCRRDEMPPKRGRTRGRGSQLRNTPESTPAQPGSAQQSHGRGRAARTLSSFEQDEPQIIAERSYASSSSGPSSSTFKESQKGHKVAPEGYTDDSRRGWTGKSHDEASSKPSTPSHRGRKVDSEKHHREYRRSQTEDTRGHSRGYQQSAAREYHRERDITSEKGDYRYKQRHEESPRSRTEDTRGHFRGYQYSTSDARKYHRERHITPEDDDYKQKYEESQKSWTGKPHKSKYRTETSYDSEIPMHPTASEQDYRRHEVSREETGFKTKKKFSEASEPSLSEKESHKKSSDFNVKQKSYDESRRHSKTEASHDYEPSGYSTSSEHKEKKINPEDIGFKYKHKESKNVLLPKRPGFGKEGRHIRVVSNLYPIEFPSGYVFHYDIEITENNVRKSDTGHKKYRCLNTKRNREVLSFMLKNVKEFKRSFCAFDGQANLFSREELKIKLPYTCTVNLPFENQDPENLKFDCFKIEIKSLVSRINLDSIKAFYDNRCNDLPQEAIMVLETILRHGPCQRFTPINRSFFSPDIADITPFGGGLDIWYGYHQSIRLSQWQPTVNLDISATTFWRAGPVLDFIAENMKMNLHRLRGLQFLSRNDVRRINRKIKQKQIKVTHLPYGRKYRIVRLRDLGANQEHIELTGKDGKKTRTTVSQYFKDTYKITLQYGNLPCVQVQPENKNIFLPIEVCNFIEGQHYKGELTQLQRTKMIQNTSKPPHERFKTIENIVKKADINRDETVEGFGIHVSEHPLVVDARVLDSPDLVYRNEDKSEKRISVRDGQWDARRIHFFQPAKISAWVLISFKQDDNLTEFAKTLMRIGKNFGLKIDRPPKTIFADMYCDKAKLFSDVKKDKNDLAVISIPNLDESAGTDESALYNEIKKAAEVTVGLTTQCIKEERLWAGNEKRWNQIASNLCLKINAKLGGENHSLFQRHIPNILIRPVMIIGADVNHPPPTQLNQPSIAACVGSLDCFGKRFAVSLRAQVNSSPQKTKVEHILDLEDMVYDLLLAFYRHTGTKKPEKIIFYRDGVSEGELMTVKKEEVRSIRKACLKHNEDYKPGITVVVVQKRHHVRFRPYDRKDGVGPKGNIPPGTVVDTKVTHPQNFDFFLCSQFGLQGTSRPSHYLVLEDDNNLSADELQKLTFHMCHMSVRCTKSISIPAPVAYADLVAYRARKHLESKYGDSSSSSDCSRTYRLTQSDIDAIQVVEKLKNSMYFV